MSSPDALACTYATLLLHDGNVPISAPNIKKLVESSGNKSFNAVYANIFADALKKIDVNLLLSSLGTSAANMTDSSSAASSKQEKAEEAGGKSKQGEKQPEKKEEKEEEDDDLGFGLFD